MIKPGDILNPSGAIAGKDGNAQSYGRASVSEEQAVIAKRYGWEAVGGGGGGGGPSLVLIERTNEKAEAVLRDNARMEQLYKTATTRVNQVDEPWCFGYGKNDVASPSGNERINHPSHYGGDTQYEVIKVLKAWLTRDEYIGFCKGNAIKYQARHRHKGGDEDLRKASWYTDELNRYLEEHPTNATSR